MKKLALVTLLVFGLAISASAYTITFSEFAVGTIITTQYAFAGISLFSAPFHSTDAAPTIRTDGANPTSPVLSAATDSFSIYWATPDFPYGADIKFTFEGSGTTHFGFDIGYIDNPGNTKALVTGVLGNTLFNGLVESHLGINRFNFGILGTERVRHVYVWTPTPTEEAGWAIDNLATTPEPATLFLLGSGLLGMGGFRALRKRKK